MNLTEKMHNLFRNNLYKTGIIKENIYVIKDLLINSYVIKTNEGLICIDTGFRKAHMQTSFEYLGLDPTQVVAVFLTHLHWDHCFCASLFSHARIFVGSSEPVPRLNKIFFPHHKFYAKVTDNDTLSFGDTTVLVIQVQGHTQGSVCYLIDNTTLFSGDSLCVNNFEIKKFYGFLNQDSSVLENSIKRHLAGRKSITSIFTAHSGGLIDTGDCPLSKWKSFQSQHTSACKDDQT